MFYLEYILVSVTVGYEAEIYTAMESEEKIKLAIVIINPPSGAPTSFTLALSTYDHTAGKGDVFHKKDRLYMFSFKDSPDDFEPVMKKLLQFNAGDIRVNHTVKIIDDVICESCPTQVFFCNISLLTNDPLINISQDHARVMIVDCITYRARALRNKIT